MIQMKNICVTTDFSINSAAVIPYALDIAKLYSSQIWLVHVFDGTYLYEAAEEGGEGHFPNPAHWLDPIYARLENKLQEDAAQLSANHGIRFNPVLLKGDTVSEIVKYIKSAEVDCLILSTHGRTGLAHMLFGSIAERLVRSSSCPVLTIRPPPHR